jgi:hypothetical protein
MNKWINFGQRNALGRWGLRLFWKTFDKDGLFAGAGWQIED